MSDPMLFKFPQSISRKSDNLHDYIENRYVKKFVTYVMNSDYRKAVNVKTWIKEQQIPSILETELCDAIVLNELKITIRNLEYAGDKKSWKILEYWQTIFETQLRKTGDCEDGAVLLYTNLRMKGVPANRLLLMCGDVVGGGHCWLAYRPDDYPLNWVFLDWCYEVNTKPVGQRDFYYVYDKQIYCIGADGIKKKSKYYKLWFAFNENSSFVSLKGVTN